MASDNQRLLQISALIVPIVLAAAGGKWAVDAASAKALPASALPSPEELDALRSYVSHPAPSVPAPGNEGLASVSSSYAAGADPFEAVSRSEAPRYFAPAGSGITRNEGPRWVVSTIMITGTRRVAVVNGQMVTPGSVLPGGSRVQEIEPDHVVILEAGGARKEISVQAGAN